VSIQIHPDLRVMVRAPLRCPRAVIEAYLAERAAWIERQVERFRRLAHEREPPPRHVSGETHFYMGEAHRLEIVTGTAPGVDRAAGVLVVALPLRAGPEAARRLLEDWYRLEAKKVFGTVLAERFATFGVRHALPALRVRAMKTRWGSLCGASRGGTDVARMTLNLALIRAPRSCIEYVVTHELCHLEHRGHGRRFYGLLERLLPDWRARRQTLNSLPLL
jgi:predicted metal-dependent hydrolase